MSSRDGPGVNSCVGMDTFGATRRMLEGERGLGTRQRLLKHIEETTAGGQGRARLKSDSCEAKWGKGGAEGPSGGPWPPEQDGVAGLA